MHYIIFVIYALLNSRLYKMIVKTSTNQSNAIINHLLWKRNAASAAGCKTHSIRRSIRISLYRKYWGSLICRSQYSTIRFASFHGNLINVAQASLSNENSTAPSSTFTKQPWFIALFDERGGLRISSGLVSCLFIRLGGKGGEGGGSGGSGNPRSPAWTYRSGIF